MSSPKIGEILLENGLIAYWQLQEALKIQEKTGKKLGSILIELQYITSHDLGQVLANIYKVPSIDLERYRIKVEMADLIPEEYCRQKHVVPLKIKDKNLSIAIENPNNYTIIRDLEFITNYTITAIVAPEVSIDRAIEDLFRRAREEQEKTWRAREEQWLSQKNLDEQVVKELPTDQSAQTPAEPAVASEISSSEEVEEVSSSQDRSITFDEDIGESDLTDVKESNQFPSPEVPVTFEKDLKSLVSEEKLEKLEKHLTVGKNQIHQILQSEISKAIEKGATHIHFEPKGENFEIKIRVLGEIQSLSTFPQDLFQPLIQELKNLSTIDPTSVKQLQKGMFKFFHNHHEILITAHFLLYGDLARVVLYIQRNFDLDWQLDNLGFSPDLLKTFREILSYPRGITIFSGPPGNGKTTTIYTTLKELVLEKKVIITYENPIRYRLNGVIQVESQDRYGESYLSGLGKILDQNPDVLYLDGIADPNLICLLFNEISSCSKVFIRSILESSVGILSYFLELLRSPYPLTASLQAILAQRLLNCLCNHCKSTYKPSPRTVERIKDLLDVKNFDLYKSEGCEECNYTGFKGQTAIFELLLINEKTKSKIITEQKELLYPVPSEMVLRKIFYSPETVTLMKDGLRKALEGITTIAEVVRAVGLSNYITMIG